jgi:hypothetical protein
MPKNFSQKGFTKNFLNLMKQEEKNKECCLDFLTQIFTQNSTTILFSGLGTTNNPLTAVVIGGSSSGITDVVTANSAFIDLSGNGTPISPLIATLDPSGATNGLQVIGGKIGLGGRLTQDTVIINNPGTGHHNITISGTNFDSGLPGTIAIDPSNNNFLQYHTADPASNCGPVVQNTAAGGGAAAGYTTQNDLNHTGYFYTGSSTNAFSPDAMLVGAIGAVGGLQLLATAGPITFNASLAAPVSNSEMARFDRTTSNFGIGVTTPTARLHLKAGTATAHTGPLKFNPGVLVTVLELGLIEFTDDGTTGHMFITLNQAGTLTRVQIV